MRPRKNCKECASGDFMPIDTAKMSGETKANWYLYTTQKKIDELKKIQSTIKQFMTFRQPSWKTEKHIKKWGMGVESYGLNADGICPRCVRKHIVEIIDELPEHKLMKKLNEIATDLKFSSYHISLGVR